jgi:two-component system, NtrC family, response regulator GlrR
MRQKSKPPPVGTETQDAPGSDRAIQKFWLHVVEGPDAGTSFSSRGARTTVGSHQGSDLVLTDRLVSRYHCEIELCAGKAVLRDLGSRNGTRIAGVTVREALLEQGATLTLGRTALRFEFDADLLSFPVSESHGFGRLVGRSVAMRQLFALLERGAQASAPVLLVGESGTGKGTAALSLHEAGARRDGPFVIVDCATNTSDVGASLFGEVPSSSAIAAAAGGTVFLEEIGALSAEHQTRLIRWLEAEEQQQPASARIVSSSRRDLRAEVNAGRFRADLYYRLAVIVARLPPLREHTDDIEILASHLLGDGAAPAILAGLEFQPWPGNVSELRNHLERAAAFGHPARSVVGVVGALRKVDAPDTPLRVARDRALQDFERAYLEQLLARTGDNVTAAARIAGVDRVHFYRLLWRYGLR